MRQWKSYVVGLAFIAGCGVALHPPPAPDRNLKVDTTTDALALKNGARVMLVHDSTTDLVHVAARYDVGATEDPPGKHGMAHLAEHLTFLLRFGGHRLDEKLSSVSLGYNAYTNLDVTHYYSVGSDSQLEALLGIESSRLMPGLCQTISDDDFAREREVVLNELRTRYRKGSTEITDLINDAVYGAKHPYDRRVGGTEEQVASITKQEACAFIDRYYVPAHVTVIITGNARRAAFGAAVEKTLATVPGRAPVPAHRPSRVTIHHATRDYKLPVDAAQLYLVWTLPPMLTLSGLLPRWRSISSTARPATSPACTASPPTSAPSTWAAPSPRWR